METFSLLKYWRGGGAAANVRTTTTANPASAANVRTTTIAASVLRPSMESDGEEDEGSFFDLEFAEQNAPGNEDDSTSEESVDEEAEDQGELNFTVSSSSSSSSASSDPSVSLSSSDDLFFKGQLLPLEPSSIVITTTSSDSDTKISQFPASLLKSATKFPVFMLGLKKPKSLLADPNATTTPPKQNQNQSQTNKFFIKFKVEEVPIVSLFTRESNSSKKSTLRSPRPEEEAVVTTEEKLFSKEKVQKYINKIKPLYVRVSKRYGEKLRFSGQLTAEVAASADVTGGDEAVGEAIPAPVAPAAAAPAAKVKIPAGLRVVRKRLGKSKSASSGVVAAVASPPVAQQRRDDSLLMQQDGIQSAIAHCKRSLNDTSKNVAAGPVEERSERG